MGHVSCQGGNDFAQREDSIGIYHTGQLKWKDVHLGEESSDEKVMKQKGCLKKIWLFLGGRDFIIPIKKHDLKLGWIINHSLETVCCQLVGCDLLGENCWSMGLMKDKALWRENTPYFVATMNHYDENQHGKIRFSAAFLVLMGMGHKTWADAASSSQFWACWSFYCQILMGRECGSERVGGQLFQMSIRQLFSNHDACK